MVNISFLIRHRMVSQIKKPTHLLVFPFACGRSWEWLTRSLLSWAKDGGAILHAFWIVFSPDWRSDWLAVCICYGWHAYLLSFVGFSETSNGCLKPLLKFHTWHFIQNLALIQCSCSLNDVPYALKEPSHELVPSGGPQRTSGREGLWPRSLGLTL